MSEIVKLRTRAEIDEQAAVWVWRMEAGQLEGAASQEFECWLRQDPRHRRAVEELSNVWSALDVLAEAKRDEKIATFTDVATGSAARWRLPWWLSAAAVLVLALGGVLWMSKAGENQTLATAVGQHRAVTLADGSVVTLNTNTIVETNLTRSVRQIYLRKGQAHFEVAHDRSRPFLVHAGNALVRAVGTAFEVRLGNDQQVNVLVNEGRVEVQADTMALSTPTSGSSKLIRAVRAGEQISTTAGNYSVVPVTQSQIMSELAWREGAIVFDSEPLSAAIAEIGRYSDARIVISDPRVAAMHIGGRFRTDDLQGFLDGLQAALPVTIRRSTDGSVYVDPADDSSRALN
jgi:transmembrane sensor